MLMCHSEFLCTGDKLLFREGRTKGLGIVTAIGFDKNKFPTAIGKDKEFDVKEQKKGDKGARSGTSHEVKREAARA